MVKLWLLGMGNRATESSGDMELKEHENIAKTSTPSKHQHPLSWYVKWAASITLIAAMILTANNLYPYNLLSLIHI